MHLTDINDMDNDLLCVKQNRCGSIILRVKNQPILSLKHSGTPAKSPLSPMILLRKTI